MPAIKFFLLLSILYCAVARFTVFSPVEQVLCSNYRESIGQKTLKSDLCAIKCSATSLVFCLHGRAQLGEKKSDTHCVSGA
jgi:hypothetical protein